jgi:hypothetical protein
MTPRPLEPHYYVGWRPPVVGSSARTTRPVCGRSGCGRPLEDPIHLRPPSDTPVRKVANG